MADQLPGTEAVVKEADLSPCGRYRYRLTRTWEPHRARAVFAMLNPSTADADADDPTIRRCMDFARRWGMGGIVVVNLYAYRATKPADLLTADDPVGPDNHMWVAAAIAEAGARSAPFVAAWGAWRSQRKTPPPCTNIPELARRQNVPLQCLGTTLTGEPRHPLYLLRSADLTPWGARRG